MSPTKATTKKCGGACKKTKPTTGLYHDQNSCKMCVNGGKKLDRRAKAEGLEDWLNRLKVEETWSIGYVSDISCGVSVKRMASPPRSHVQSTSACSS